MGRIIFSVVSLIALAVLVVLNAGTNASFNLFGQPLEEVPIVAIVLVSFVAGVLYSFIYYVSGYFARQRKEKLAMQKQRLKSQEQTIKSKDASLKAREKEVERAASDSAPRRQSLPPAAGADSYGARVVGSGSTSTATPAPGTNRKRGGFLRNLFGRKTNAGT